MKGQSEQEKLKQEEKILALLNKKALGSKKDWERKYSPDLEGYRWCDREVDVKKMCAGTEGFPLSEVVPVLNELQKKGFIKWWGQNGLVITTLGAKTENIGKWSI